MNPEIPESPITPNHLVFLEGRWWEWKELVDEKGLSFAQGVFQGEGTIKTQGQTVFVVCLEERHISPYVWVFYTRDLAMSFAKKTLDHYQEEHHIREEREGPASDKDGLVWVGWLENEGATVFVSERPLLNKIEEVGVPR